MNAPRGLEPRQTTSRVLMVRPATFYANPETLASNAFQHADASAPEVSLAAARAEFDTMVQLLSDAGVRVAVADAEASADTPDALFPNNWFSTHADGRLVLYPMAAANRRRERRPQLIAALAAQHGWRIARSTDLSALEERGLIVEGTGSLVLDRVAGIAYAILSPRTHREALDLVCRELGYTPLAFHAHDRAGRAVYHTNVLMSVGPTLALLGSALVSDATERKALHASFERAGKALLDLSAAQIDAFAGNALFLEDDAGVPLVAISRRAWLSLAPSQRVLLERHAAPVVCPADTIEHVGGGGVRCMIAEIFLPPA